MRILALFLLLCTLVGCSLAPNSYLSVTPHTGTPDRSPHADAVTVTNYDQLKDAILNLVQGGHAEGSIRAISYSGDLESDLATAAYEVSKTEPLGAYAVEYMTHDCTLIVSYYEIDIRITFRRTAREIASIEQMISPTLLRSRLEEAVDGLEERITLEVKNYRETDIPALVEAYCAANPATVMQMPGVSVTSYPNSGSTRILEIDLVYTEPVEILRQKRQAVQESIKGAAEYIRYRNSDREKAELLFTYLTERFIYRQAETNTPLYDALCAGVANDAGLSAAWQLACDRAGVECYTVEGLRLGEAHIWNIVSFDGEYRHVDVERDVLDGNPLQFRTDPEMSDYYWNPVDFPACRAIAEEPEAEQPPAEQQSPAPGQPSTEAPPAEEPPVVETPPEEQPPAEEPPAEEPPAEQPPTEEPPAEQPPAEEPPPETPPTEDPPAQEDPQPTP